ncbi:hypothetical protein Tco_1321936 [Tanacetum coccineum]
MQRSAIRAEEMPSLISCWMAAKVMAGVSDVDSLWYNNEDGDNDANDGDGDEREISWFYEIRYETGLPL